jgi:hypothetical protein
MKKTLAFLVLVLAIALQTFASTPACLTYSGKITDKNNNLLPDGMYNMRFTLWTAASGGTSQFNELHDIATGNGVTVTAGGFNVLLGTLAALPTNFNLPYFLQTEVMINSSWETFGR